MLSLDPLLRRVDEHADFKIDPTFPSPFYVGCSVWSVERQEFGVGGRLNSHVFPPWARSVTPLP